MDMDIWFASITIHHCIGVDKKVDKKVTRLRTAAPNTEFGVTISNFLRYKLVLIHIL